MSIKIAGEGEDNDENEKKNEDAEYIGVFPVIPHPFRRILSKPLWLFKILHLRRAHRIHQ